MTEDVFWGVGRRRVTRARARRPRTWLLLAVRAESVEPHLPAVKELLFGRHRVVFGYLQGTPPRALSRHVEAHRLTPAANLPPRARRMVERAAGLGGVDLQLRAALRLDGWLRDRLAESELVLSLDEGVDRHREALERLLPDGARHWPSPEVADVLAEERTWRYVGHRLTRLLSRDEHRETLPVVEFLEAIGWLTRRTGYHLEPEADLRRDAAVLTHRLTRRGMITEAEGVLRLADLVEERFARDGDTVPELEAIRAYHAVNRDDRPPADLADLLGRVFREADAALADGRRGDAADSAAIGLDLMFHQRLHTDVPSTPLVEDPHPFLRPFLASATGQQLVRPVPRGDAPAPPPSDSSSAPAGRRSVALLPGSYPWHARKLVAALREEPRLDVTEVELAVPGMRGMGVSATFLRWRLARSAGEGSDDDLGIPGELGEAVDRADTVFADWADKGAVWASTRLPPDARMIVRIHSVDVLSPAVHLVDWTRVSDVVFVGEHLRQIFLAMLGERVAHLRTHVIPNIVSLPEPPPDAPEPDPRTLVMVGWAQRVKDPLMALEILAELRRREPGWRLRLIGSDFLPTTSEAVRSYMTRFRRRVIEPDLIDAVEFVGQTREVVRHVADAGFVLSTSLRESFHIGAMEAVAAGAFPVVREWPAYARYRGAAGIFPAECVVTTVEEAVELIWSLREPAERDRAAARVREQLAGVLRGSAAAERLRALVLD